MRDERVTLLGRRGVGVMDVGGGEGENGSDGQQGQLGSVPSRP
jgi:hypothetical protein